MNNPKVIIIFVIIVLIFAGGAYSLTQQTKSPVSIEDMKQCVLAKECVPVVCFCNCSSGWGFAYDDVVNREYEKLWYSQQGCAFPSGCLEVECPTINAVDCENGRCVVKEGEEAQELIEKRGWSVWYQPLENN